MFDMFTFGETMLRLSPPGVERLEDTQQLYLTTGGTESNVASNLARLGKKVGWMSRMPDTPLGRTAINTVRQHGVDTSHVRLVTGERMGLYFLENGVPPRGVSVIYDRADSAASKLSPEDLPLDVIASSRWLHLTGITPALSKSCSEAVQVAIDHAKANNVIVSFDVNYRALLWDAKTAGEAVTSFCAAADYVFVALRDAINLLGCTGEAPQAMQQLQQRWNNIIIMTDGGDGAYAATADEQVETPGRTVEIVDRVGAGDAFAAGVICRLLEDAPLEAALQFGVAIASLALTIPGDIARITRPEVEALLSDDANLLNR